MRWQDVRGLRLAGVLYLVWWIIVLGADMFFRAHYSTHLHPGQIDLETGVVITASGVVELAEPLVSLMILALPFVAGILAGWWWTTAMQGDSWLGGSLLLGLFAGLISLGALGLVDLAFNPKTNSSWVPDFSGLIVIIALVVGPLFGALGSIVGALAAIVYWRARGSGRDRIPAQP